MDKEKRELLKKLLDEQKNERQRQKAFIKKTQHDYDHLHKEGFELGALPVLITMWKDNLRVVEKHIEELERALK